MSEMFPFVVGCPRSGTTLLRAMLDSHPQLAVPPEAYFVLPVIRRRAAFVRPGGGVDRAAVLAEVQSSRSFSFWQLPAATLDAISDDPSLETPVDVLRALYRAYASEHGKARYADKTPQNVLHLELLSRSFPEARFVHLIRDGRDVVPSLQEKPFYPDRFPEAVLYWRERVENGRRGGARVGPARYLEVRYESLVEDPEAVLRDVCAFLELDYTPAMLDYQRRAQEITARVYDPDAHAGIHRAPTPGYRDWRSAMSPRDQRRFEALAGDLLDALGYERCGLPVPARARLESAAWRARAGLERRARLLRMRAGRRLTRGVAAAP